MTFNQNRKCDPEIKRGVEIGTHYIDSLIAFISSSSPTHASDAFLLLCQELRHITEVQILYMLHMPNIIRAVAMFVIVVLQTTIYTQELKVFKIDLCA